MNLPPSDILSHREDPSTQRSASPRGAPSCPHNPSPISGEGQGECPAIDRVELHVAGQLVTMRQAAIRVLGRMINFVEEEQLNIIARMIDDGRMLKSDLERAITSWAMSQGSKSMKYFAAIIDKMLDEHKRQIANNRTATLPEVVINDKEDAGRFLAYLKDRGYHGTVIARGDATVFKARDVQDWHNSFVETQNIASPDIASPVGASHDSPRRKK